MREFACIIIYECRHFIKHIYEYIIVYIHAHVDVWLRGWHGVYCLHLNTRQVSNVISHQLNNLLNVVPRVLSSGADGTNT